LFFYSQPSPVLQKRRPKSAELIKQA